MEHDITEFEKRLAEILQALADPQLYKDRTRHRDLMRENAHLLKIMNTHAEYTQAQGQLDDVRKLVAQEQDLELRQLARQEVETLTATVAECEQRLAVLLVPHDPLDNKNAILEIRAGTGGDEASLFVADLYRMYSRYAEQHSLKVELLSNSPTEVGGFKEAIFSIVGEATFGMFRYESGVHRVQRVPTTESSGRIHTSAVTVAVLPEAEESDMVIRSDDLRFDVYRSSGPGGQSVNTTDSAVRVTHLPTGITVTCQDEKSQHKNKAKAMRVLRSRLLEADEQKRRAERDSTRRSQVGSGDRSERIRTYNFPQNRLTDHRINLTLYRLDQIMDGDLNEIFECLHLKSNE